jgi:tRNA threonylcarbamoyladenosine biosynthesis protein TsaB
LIRILAMDTATSSCSVALWCDGAIVAARNKVMTRGQAEALVPMINNVLDEAKVTASHLDLLAVTVGPGAFTGLRIGLATARGMGLAAHVPCLGLTTTEAIAHAVNASAWQQGTLLVALDSKRADIYVQAFQLGLKPISEASAMDPAILGEWLQGVPCPIHVVGDARVQATAALIEAGHNPIVIESPEVPDGSVLAELASRRWTPGDILVPPLPLYLRPPDAKLPKDGGRLRP